MSHSTGSNRPPIGGYLTLFKLFISSAIQQARAAPTRLGVGVGSSGEEGTRWLVRRAEEAVSTQQFTTKLVFSIFFVLIGGVFSGLTLGLMDQGVDGELKFTFPVLTLTSFAGLDSTNLRVLSTSGTPQQQHDARKVLSLLHRGRHWVLVSLLLGNVVVNETLPVFLDAITGGGGLTAILLSSSLIVIFGEILPQAVCGRHGLRIGAKCVGFVRVLLWIEAPIAWPVAKLLDWLLGESHGTMYRKIELKTLVGLHGHTGGDSLSEDEVTIISAVLDLSDKPLSAIMTPIEDVFSLPSDTLLDRGKVDKILALGHSRVPIHTVEKDEDFVGMLIVKNLITYDPSEAKAVGSFPLTALPETLPESTCLDALNYFQQGRSHMLLVTTTPGMGGGAVGVVSLEDVVEELLGKEIIDETDVFVDVHHRVPVVRPHTRDESKRVSIGLAPFIKGIIDRRGAHRDSSSVSSVSHSHHVSTSISHLGGNGNSYAPLSSSDSHPYPPPPIRSKFVVRSNLHSSVAVPPDRPPGGAAGEKGFTFPSPVQEETAQFSLGEYEDETDGEGAKRERGEGKRLVDVGRFGEKWG